MSEYKKLVSKNWIHFIINQKGIYEDLHKELITIDKKGYLTFLNITKPNTPFNLSLISIYFLSIRAMAKTTSSGMYYCNECGTNHYRDDSFQSLKRKLSASTLKVLSEIESKYL